MPDEKNEHNVFISWSGERSRHVARALRNWLPMVLQAAKPFMSKKDIDKGARWHVELARALEVTKVGIICLTPENMTAPWLLFESGALSKTVDKGTRVCTYLLGGLKPEQVRSPLSEFQATKAEPEETKQLLQSMNVALGSPITEATLTDVFEAMWPKLEAVLKNSPEPEQPVPEPRDVTEMVGELLDIFRAEGSRQMQGLQVLSDQVARVEQILTPGPFGFSGLTAFAGRSTDLAWLTPGSVGPAIPSPGARTIPGGVATEPVGIGHREERPKFQKASAEGNSEK